MDAINTKAGPMREHLCPSCGNTGLTEFDQVQGWQFCHCDMGTKKAAQFRESATSEAKQLSSALRVENGGNNE